MNIFSVVKKRAFTLTKNKSNCMYPKRHAMDNLRIYLTEINEVEAKFQNGTLNQEVSSMW